MMTCVIFKLYKLNPEHALLEITATNAREILEVPPSPPSLGSPPQRALSLSRALIVCACCFVALVQLVAQAIVNVVDKYVSFLERAPPAKLCRVASAGKMRTLFRMEFPWWGSAQSRLYLQCLRYAGPPSDAPPPIASRARPPLPPSQEHSPSLGPSSSAGRFERDSRASTPLRVPDELARSVQKWIDGDGIRHPWLIAWGPSCTATCSSDEEAIPIAQPPMEPEPQLHAHGQLEMGDIVKATLSLPRLCSLAPSLVRTLAARSLARSLAHRSLVHLLAGARERSAPSRGVLHDVCQRTSSRSCVVRKKRTASLQGKKCAAPAMEHERCC